MGRAACRLELGICETVEIMTTLIRGVVLVVTIGIVYGCCIPLYDLPWCQPQGVKAPADPALMMACRP